MRNALLGLAALTALALAPVTIAENDPCAPLANGAALIASATMDGGFRCLFLVRRDRFLLLVSRRGVTLGVRLAPYGVFTVQPNGRKRCVSGTRLSA